MRKAAVTRCVCPNAAHGVFKILYLHYFMNDCEFNGLPQSGLALNRIYHGDCLEAAPCPQRGYDSLRPALRRYRQCLGLDH